MIDAAVAFWRENILLANISHAALGFGLAIVLQRYFAGRPFLPAAVGWLLLAFAIGTHVLAFTR